MPKNRPDFSTLTPEEQKEYKHKVQAAKKRKKRRHSRDTMTALIAKHSALEDVANSSSSPALPSNADKRDAALMEAYSHIVEDGISCKKTAKIVGLSLSTLNYWYRKLRWAEARSQWQAIQYQATEGEDITEKALATEKLILVRIQQASSNLKLIQNIVERKILQAVSQTKPQKVTDRDGNQKQIDIPTISPKDLNDLANTQMNLLAKMKALANMSEARSAKNIHRLAKAKKAQKARLARKAMQVQAMAAPSPLDEDKS